jgi:type IV pilus assembly protein PilA
MKNLKQGFTLIETLVVVAVIAILALMALPSVQAKYVREQIVEGSVLAGIAKTAVAGMWLLSHTLPPDNASAGLPEAEKIVNNVVKAVTVKDGAVHITYGNQANANLRGKTLSLRPAVVEDAPIVPVTWVCASAPVPNKMTVRGENKTDIGRDYLPLNCR